MMDIHVEFRIHFNYLQLPEPSAIPQSSSRRRQERSERPARRKASGSSEKALGEVVR